MKKTLLALSFLVFPVYGFSYSWYPIGPTGIVANNVCFYIDNAGHNAICADNGLWIDDSAGYNWAFYSYGGLPVQDVTYFDGQDILLVQGNGTYSDGIYKLNMTTHQFEVKEWIFKPHFIQYEQIHQLYYAGSASGLYTSPNGSAWGPLSFFTGEECTRMIYLNNNIIISLENYLFNIAYSSDGGTTWSYSAGAPPICDMGFNNIGILYGIFPDHSNSSGIWKSMDFGATWSVVTWIENLSSIVMETGNNIFIGWEEPYAGNEGVAYYNSQALSLTFFNSGLPNTCINRLATNLYMSSYNVFACTDGGVFRLFDYLTGLPGSPEADRAISLFPNPAAEVINLQCPSWQAGKFLEMSILDMAGRVVKTGKLEAGSGNSLIPVSLKGLEKGMYSLRLAGGSEITYLKFIKCD